MAGMIIHIPNVTLYFYKGKMNCCPLFLSKDDPLTVSTSTGNHNDMSELIDSIRTNFSARGTNSIRLICNADAITAVRI